MAEHGEVIDTINDRQQAEIYQKLFQMGFQDDNASKAASLFPNNMDAAINYAVQHEQQYKQSQQQLDNNVFKIITDWIRWLIKLPRFNWFTLLLTVLFMIYTTLNIIVLISTFFPNKTVVNIVMWSGIFVTCMVLCAILVTMFRCAKYVWNIYKPKHIALKLQHIIIATIVIAVVMNTYQIWINSQNIETHYVEHTKDIQEIRQNVAENKENIKKNAENIGLNRIAIETVQNVYYNLKERVDGLENTTNEINDALIKKEKIWNNAVNELIKNQSSIWAQMDEIAGNMWLGFGLITITRRKFGLGCFVKDTLIQIDQVGNVKKIQDLNESDTIFNPDLRQAVKMKVFTMDPEYGYVYQFVTKDLLNVTVTKTHPMKICVSDNYHTMNMKCDNIAASNVYAGNMTETVNGYQEIMEVNKILVDGVMVYNMWLDIDEEEGINHRSIIANGVFTFDLKAQTMNE